MEVPFDRVIIDRSVCVDTTWFLAAGGLVPGSEDGVEWEGLALFWGPPVSMCVGLVFIEWLAPTLGIMCVSVSVSA